VISFTAVTGKIAIAVLLAGVLAAVGIALFRDDQAGVPIYTSVAQVKPDLADSDPRLKLIYTQAGDLLGGSRPAFDKRIESLRGLPIVINKWGSWCPPCRGEFPAFQDAAKSNGGRIAFIGVNSADNADDATAFMKQHPVPYPSYVDGYDLKIAKLLKPAGFAPVTAFFNASGRLVHTHPGPYNSAAALKSDIRRYATFN
jgi:thiol-disulfide isomerase/thioredoxin